MGRENAPVIEDVNHQTLGPKLVNGFCGHAL